MKDLGDLKNFLKGPGFAGRAILLGLDFDGTLAAIVSRPGRARLSARARRCLLRLKKNPRVFPAIISGRRLSDVRSLAAVKGIYYSGNHGLEIEGPGLRWRHPGAKAAAAGVRGMARLIAAKLKDFPGATLDDKGLSLSVHYRAMGPGGGAALRRWLGANLKPWAASVRLAGGKKVWEIRPKVSWNKGRALLKIAGRLRGAPVLFFIGDDKTDEEGFRALGRRAVTVRVGPVRRSSARFVLKRRSEVDSFLESLGAALGRGDSGR